MELKSLSASKIKTFSSCPRKFMYEYIERQEKVKHPAAVMGTAVHKAIDTVYKAWRSDLAAPDPREVYWNVWADEILKNAGMQTDQKLLMDGLSIVEKYDFSKAVPKDTEVEFRLPFPNSIEPICEMHGFIDQMFDWGLKDMKTSKRKPMQFALNNDLQFIIYRWAFKELTGDSPSDVFWFHLRTQEDIAFDLSKDKTDFAARVVERILESNETGVYDRCIGESCVFCSYRAVCLEGV
jgi:hypothetical protein